MFCLVHPPLRLANHPLIIIESTAEPVLKLRIMQVKRVNHLHLDCAQLLPPLFELVLDLPFDLHLPLLEQRVMLVVASVTVQVDALGVHGLVHLHKHFSFKLDFLGHVFFLSHIMTFVGTEEGTLSTHTLLVRDTDQF